MKILAQYHLLQPMEFAIDEPDQTRGSFGLCPSRLGTGMDSVTKVDGVRGRGNHYSQRQSLFTLDYK